MKIRLIKIQLIYIDSTIIPEYKNMIVVNPSNTLDGYLPKARVIKNDKRLLYKRQKIYTECLRWLDILFE